MKSSTNRKFIFVSILLFGFHVAFSQEKLQFDRLEHVKGLENRSIICMIQDDFGFMWFGTQAGLIRYDGYEIKTYKSNLKDKNSLGDNDVRALAKDKHGNLWIATQGAGLDKFDIRTEQFTHYRYNPNDPNSLSGNSLFCVIVDSKGMVWTGTFSNGINMLDPSTNKFTRIPEQQYMPVHSIMEDSNGMIWFNSNGITRVNPKDFTSQSFPASPDDPQSISNGGITTLYQDKAGKIWVGADNSGLFQFDVDQKKFIPYHLSSNSSLFTSVFTMREDSLKRLWVGGSSGLAIIEGKDVKIYQHDPADKYSISTNSVRVIYFDSNGTTWVGNDSGGVNKLFSKKKFQLFRHTDEPTSISSNLIRSIYEDTQGRIWIGTQGGGGLNIFDRKTNTFKLVSAYAKVSIANVFEDRDGTFWIGSWGSGLYHHNFNNDHVIQYHHIDNENSLPDDRIQVTYRDKKGVLWVGTENGLCQFNEANNEWVSFDKPNFPAGLKGSNVQGQAFTETSDGSIWIGTWFGLNVISPDRKSVKYITSDTTAEHFLSSDHVISLHYDTKNNQIWAGTFGGGLNQLNLSDGMITHYTEEDGLPNNTVYGIKQDDEGNLWVSTNNGLSRFNPATKKFRNYDATEGLQSNEFYWGAAGKTRDGKMIFGGVNGINIFDPKEIEDDSKVPPIVITNFELFNKPIVVKKGTILEQNINLTKTLVLNYNQNVLNFQYSALNYNSPEKNLYAYYLENFDNDWNYVGSKRNVTYTNLSPGEYILHIKGSNNDGVWNEKGIALEIVVVPPFWRTWWFYSIVCVTGVALIYLIIKLRLRSVRRDKEMLRVTLQEALDKAHEELEREKKAVIEEQNKNHERNWIDQSVSIISEILSKSKDNVEELSKGVLAALVKRCEVVAGAIYLYDEKTEELVKQASYGFTEIRHTIAAGSGQIGECFEKRQTVTINNMPDNYFSVSSGLGSASPKSLLIVPLQYEEICVGVIELASFQEIPLYRKQFIETLSAQLTATIHTTQISQRTSHLLEESKHQTEELKVREEELKQNLEEMQSIQEDFTRKRIEYERTIQELQAQLGSQ